MSEEKNGKVYPVTSLHEFLYELDKEWSKFRNGTIISLISSVVLFILVVGILIRTRHFGLGLVDFVLLIFVGVLLAYSIYAMYSQFRFFSRWERRIGLLLHMEDEILAEKLGEKQA